jgi:hypothetical protein
MQLGDRWKMTIPSDLAFGPKGRYVNTTALFLLLALLQIRLLCPCSVLDPPCVSPAVSTCVTLYLLHLTHPFYPISGVCVWPCVLCSSFPSIVEISNRTDSPLLYRPSSAGKPRIPGDAIIVFEVEIVGLPGKEPELIELIGSVDE